MWVVARPLCQLNGARSVNMVPCYQMCGPILYFCPLGERGRALHMRFAKDLSHWLITVMVAGTLDPPLALHSIIHNPRSHAHRDW